MESIITSGPSDDDQRKHAYLVKYKAYAHDENRWATYKNVVKCALDLSKDYYGKNPLIERDRRYGTRKRSK
jgi:hypothetical protein